MLTSSRREFGVTIVDRKSICEAQAAICMEQAHRNDLDRAYWLAEARRWHDMAGEHVHTTISFDRIGNAAKSHAQVRAVHLRDG